MKTWKDIACPIQRTAELIADVYILMILRDLIAEPRRFSELEHSGINPRTLTNRLKQLMDEGMVSRAVYREKPPRVEYCLTSKGRALLPVLDALRQYGETWLPVQESQQ